jgi:hypothetical protein
MIRVSCVPNKPVVCFVLSISQICRQRHGLTQVYPLPFAVIVPHEAVEPTAVKPILKWWHRHAPSLLANPVAISTSSLAKPQSNLENGTCSDCLYRVFRIINIAT